MEIPDEQPIAAFTRREDPRDALVLPLGAQEWDQSRPIGSSSARRKIQLQALFPGVEIQPVRGNVLTRLEKLDRGEFGALVLAAAGLKRLGLEGRIRRYFEPEELLPAAGQGILAVQCRAGLDRSLLSGAHSREAEICALAERAFVRALDGGCSSPVAAHATIAGDAITITGLYVDGRGRPVKGTARGPGDQGEALACGLAQNLKEGAACLER